MQTDQQFRWYIKKSYFDYMILNCDLDLEGNNPLFPQDALAYDNLSSDQVWLPKNQQFRRYSRENNILIIWALVVTLTLEIAHNFFPMTLWLIMLNHHTMFGNKCFVVHKISLGQIFTDILNLHCDLDLERSNPILPQDTLAYNAVLPN